MLSKNAIKEIARIDSVERIAYSLYFSKNNDVSPYKLIMRRLKSDFEKSKYSDIATFCAWKNENLNSRFIPINEEEDIDHMWKVFLTILQIEG